MKILILNGSVGGRNGNCSGLIQQITHHLPSEETEVIHLEQEGYSPTLKERILSADGYIFLTGTYWDSWGSPLQKFLEEWTELEGHLEILGKPCSVVVLMHSVGGKGILSRLQGVLSSFGFLIPPMSGLVLSLVSQSAQDLKTDHSDDFWSEKDLNCVIYNLLQGCRLNLNWKAWCTDHTDPKRIWFKPNA